MIGGGNERVNRKAKPAPQAAKAGQAGAKKTAKWDRFGVLNAFVDFTMGKLRENERQVWLILFRDTLNGVAQTGIMDISRRAGVGEKTIRRCKKILTKLGLLEEVRRGTKDGGASIYRVHPLISVKANRTPDCPIGVQTQPDTTCRKSQKLNKANRTPDCPLSQKGPEGVATLGECHAKRVMAYANSYYAFPFPLPFPERIGTKECRQPFDIWGITIGGAA